MHIVVCVRAARLVNKTINAERRLLFLLFLLPARIVFGEKSWDQLVGDCSRQRDSCFEIHVRIASSRISLQSISNTRLLSPPSSFAPFPLFVFPCQSLIARSDGFDFATGIEENRSPGARARAMDDESHVSKTRNRSETRQDEQRRAGNLWRNDRAYYTAASSRDVRVCVYVNRARAGVM